MGQATEYDKAKLVIGFLISNPEYKEKVIGDLKARYGETDFQSDEIDFTYTNYYNEEMGTPIKKIFLSFKELVPGEIIAETKLFTNKIEEKYSLQECRRVNIDPGFMFLSKFILPTTKDGSHRIPLHSGIFAEITLMYIKNSFRVMEWTYPDFRSDLYINLMNKIREIYKPQFVALRDNQQLT